jgi:DNA-binding MarR family transcriptional regulator
MDAGRQEPVATIEAALAQLRHNQRRDRHGAPFGGGPHGGPHGGMHGGLHGMPGMHHGRARFADVIGAARFRMLDTLLGGPASVSDIATAIGVDQPRASRLVADAVMRGLVARNADPVDARRIMVAITSSGRTWLESMRASRRSAVEDALDGFTPEERETFAALLARFVAAWPQP